MDKYIGRLLDNRYEILEVIGIGGMAVVYKARCHRLNRLVAIKILKDEYSQDEEFRRRFHAESQAVAMLSHPNIVAVYDVSTTPEADYIVMELIDGITLKQYMEKKGVLNWKETLHFSMQIAKALEHAHSRGIVHRDIKPHNVMVLKNGSVKVADFGIARVMSKSNTLTKEALGSVHYISPEQAKGGRVDNRSDIYSLGVVMSEMMTGRPPYDGDSPVAIAIQHINGGAPMPSTLNPNIPGGLEQIIMKAMAVEPNDRYASATAMLYDMDEFRKDPTMLFDFGNTPVDDATRAIPVRPESIPAAPPRNTAERVAGSRTQGSAQSRTGSAKPRGAGQSAGRSRQEDTEEERRSRSTTIAVVACAAVVIVAISIILAVLINGGGKEQDLITVPQFVGKMYGEIDLEQEGIQVIRGTSAYSDQYPRDQVIDQEPKAGEQVYVGQQVVLTLSLGPEQQEKFMENVVGLTEQGARDFLAVLNLNLLILPRTEASDTVPEGQVIRSEPVFGAPLTEGQVVTIWLSTGPEVKSAQMPKVLGLSYGTALDTLNKLGFYNVDYRQVDSIRDKEEVVGQSVDKGKVIPVDTAIILEISKGPEPTTEPPTEPTTEPPTDPPTEPPTNPPTDPTVPEDELVKKRVELSLPADRTEPYTLSIRCNGQPVIQDTVIQPGTYSITAELSGTGTQYFELYINGEYYRTEKVDFAING